MGNCESATKQQIANDLESSLKGPAKNLLANVIMPFPYSLCLYSHLISTIYVGFRASVIRRYEP
ncbi:hypothetical protein BDR05DRAFT_967923, partial [Suillus weaverae]